MKHTKGEWKVINHSNTFIWSTVMDENDKIICDTWLDTSAPEDDAEANAKLIAAAPELLEALQHALNIVDLWSPNPSIKDIKECDISEFAALSNMRSNIEKAIKKATE